MADATTAARDRIDRALMLLERKVFELKARPASPPFQSDDDLFAMPPPGSSPDDRRRIAALEAAGRDASEALAAAAAVVRQVLADKPPAEPERADDKEPD